MEGLIRQGLAAVYEGIAPSAFGRRRERACSRGCGGGGEGCG